MSDEIEYLEISVPQEKRPEEYTYTERRAEIAKAIRQRGSPTGFNYAEIGRKYDVTRETIRKDFIRLRDYFRNQIGDEAQTISDLGYRKIVREHISNGDLEDARKALDSWNGWLFDVGAQEKEPDKQEITGEDGGPVEVENAVPDSVVEAVVSSSKGRLDDNADADADDGQDQPEDTDTQQTDE